MGKKKCKVCGRPFTPKGKQEYCSELCKTTGTYLSGGGDISKPNGVYKDRKAEKVVKKGIKITEAEKERVKAVLDLPIEERWAKAKKFTSVEQAYARKLAMKRLKEEEIYASLSDWEIDDGIDDNEVAAEDLGESDDGSI